MRKQQRDEEEEWCGLDVPPLDLEYLEQWHLWHVGMKHDLSDLLEGIDEDDIIVRAKEDEVFSASSDAKKNTQDGNSDAIAIPATNAMAGGQDTIDRHNSMRNASTVALLDTAPARKDSTKEKLLKRKTTIRDSSSAVMIKKRKTTTMRPKDDITCPSETLDPHPGLNGRHTATPKSHTDCNRKKAASLDNVPCIRQAAVLLDKPAARGCKMTDSVHHTVPTSRQAKPQADSYESRLEKAKEKLHDRYMKANQRRSTQLMDFRNLPTPAQGSCQRIYKATTTEKKLNSTTTEKKLNSTKAVTLFEGKRLADINIS